MLNVLASPDRAKSKSSKKKQVPAEKAASSDGIFPRGARLHVKMILLIMEATSRAWTPAFLRLDESGKPKVDILANLFLRQDTMQHKPTKWKGATSSKKRQ